MLTTYTVGPLPVDEMKYVDEHTYFRYPDEEHHRSKHVDCI